MDEIELGQATIVYEDPDDGQTRVTVDNEEVVYARDHWMLRSGTDDEGNDLMKQIPRDRVYAVHRNVQRFEEEASTVRHRVESIASDLRERLPVGGDQERRRGTGGDTGPTRVPVTDGEREGDSESERGEPSSTVGPDNGP